ncbi:MGH1-like glycoside hydrolase domain-containing protein [Propionibacteriaceae bacterium G1746]|uniref:MGH1-like glycoside hydrolase domain-containing protein n=1 Tax=Aestuariimicrobium sp. G57 TaxID=3418485 RepID=UPI003C18A05A
MTPARKTREGIRLASSGSDDSAWRRWGPYLAARQWGTVREDYSADGNAWEYFPFEHSHQRAYRWGEDGLGGLCDRHGFFNIAMACWNGHDDRLKERLFGLTNPQGNHGEDVKEYYWALDGTPTHSWAEWLYRYPQAAFAYDDLVRTNAARGHDQPEYELADTGIFADNRFFDITVTHAKATPHDVCLEFRATNHGPDPAPLDLVPQGWFRNTWAWGRDARKASLSLVRAPHTEGMAVIDLHHAWLGRYRLAAQGTPEVMFCDNESNEVALWGTDTNPSPHPKDAINAAIVRGDASGLNPDLTGTKVGFKYHFDAIAPGQTVAVRLRLTRFDEDDPDDVLLAPFETFDDVLAERRSEAEEFFGAVIPDHVDDIDRHVARRAFAGLQWNKQLYRYSVHEWLEGDPHEPAPPPERRRDQPEGRNTRWGNLDLADVLAMPDDWEYPWFATWDHAFHCVALAHVDPQFAKNQLLLLCREWAQHPDGQLPAYEWNFSDVNPPVHAWAAWQVYQAAGDHDTEFLVRITTKLLLNFGWWVNRKDEAGNNIFEGGFLGMDNISLFDRSQQIPDGWRLEQSDATSWIAFFCLSMLRISEELARDVPAWEETATTFFHRFLSICQAVEAFGTGQVSLWDEDDGFFYDELVSPTGQVERVKVRSLVGLVPLLAVGNSPAWIEDELPDLRRRRNWLEANRPDLFRYITTEQSDDGGVQTLSLVDRTRLPQVLTRLFDPGEFLSDHGIRSLSAVYREGATFNLLGRDLSIRYTPGVSENAMFGGNSNWRGPIWFPLNSLLVDALAERGEGVGAALTWEFPTGSGRHLTLTEISDEIAARLVALFRPGPDGSAPGTPRDHPRHPLWSAHPTFSEYFDGDTGEGLGGSHQTGWTAMVAHLICRRPSQSAADSNAHVHEPSPHQTTPQGAEHDHV